MTEDLRHLVNDYFRIPTEEGPSKVTSLHQAVKDNIRPGMSIHMGVTHNRPNDLAFEIARQFWGARPNFTIICIGFRENGTPLVHGGLVKRIVSSINFDLYPTPGPNPVFQRAYKDKSVEFENWSMLTMVQRLMAGALGFSMMPTNSLIGSSIAQENPDAFKIIQDPFSSAGKVGVLKALNPDISIVHALAADQYGNAVFTPPFADPWGMLAARDGVIITVEKIVSTDFVRRNSSYVKLPGHRVKAVVEAPFGAHPGGVFASGVDGFSTYDEDYEFQVEYRAACRSKETFEAWLGKWVLGCKDHAEYLRKLGHQRLLFLKGKGDPDSWKPEIEDAISGMQEKAANPAETMVAVASRKVADKVRTNGYKVLLAGGGVPQLAAWLANYELHHSGVNIDLALELGFLGYMPRPGDSFIFNFDNIHTSKSTSEILNILGVHVGSSIARAAGTLGIAQIDKFGNINTTLIGDNLLVGSGGGNDVGTRSLEVIAVGLQSPRRFLDKVPYVTTPGDRVTMVVTDLGVMEKPVGQHELVLTEYIPDAKVPSKDEAIKRVRERCGWDLKVSPSIKASGIPLQREVNVLRLLDPKGHFIAAE